MSPQALSVQGNNAPRASPFGTADRLTRRLGYNTNEKGWLNATEVLLASLIQGSNAQIADQFSVAGGFTKPLEHHSAEGGQGDVAAAL